MKRDTGGFPFAGRRRAGGFPRHRPESAGGVVSPKCQLETQCGFHLIRTRGLLVFLREIDGRAVIPVRSTSGPLSVGTQIEEVEDVEPHQELTRTSQGEGLAELQPDRVGGFVKNLTLSSSREAETDPRRERVRLTDAGRGDHVARSEDADLRVVVRELGR